MNKEEDEFVDWSNKEEDEFVEVPCMVVPMVGRFYL